MVKIEVTKQHNDFQKLVMSGHAESGPHGHDLVCAALSGIISGALNAFDQKKEAFNIEVGNNVVSIEITQPDAETNLLMGMLIVQLKTIAQAHPKNVKIKEVG